MLYRNTYLKYYVLKRHCCWNHRCGWFAIVKKNIGGYLAWPRHSKSPIQPTAAWLPNPGICQVDKGSKAKYQRRWQFGWRKVPVGAWPSCRSATWRIAEACQAHKFTEQGWSSCGWRVGASAWGLATQCPIAAWCWTKRFICSHSLCSGSKLR
jgi:hypothetical protein